MFLHVVTLLLIFGFLGTGVQCMLLGKMPPQPKIPKNFSKFPLEKKVSTWLSETYRINAENKCIKPFQIGGVDGEMREDAFIHSCNPLVEAKVIDPSAKELKCCHAKHGHEAMHGNGLCVPAKKKSMAAFLCKCAPDGERCDGLNQCCSGIECNADSKTCAKKGCAKKGEFCQLSGDCCSATCNTRYTETKAYNCD